MGKLDNGILGGFAGKVGNVVGGTWKGISYMRAKNNNNNRKSSEKQIQQQAKFGFAMRFMQPLYPVLKLGFNSKEVKQMAQNAALSDFMNYALMGEYPDFKVDFQNLTISRGPLKYAENAAVAIVMDKIVFTWQEHENNMKLFGTNMAILVGIVEGAYPSYSINEFTRADSKGSINLPNAPSGSLVHCYIGFSANDGTRRAANSIYLGTVTIP